MAAVDDVEEPVFPACIPVTALHVSQCKHGTIVLSGVGGSLAVRDISRRASKVLTARIFASQAIHGISQIGLQHGDPTCMMSLLVWGGKSLSRCELQIQYSSKSEATLSVQVIKLWSHNVGDWIMDVKDSDSSQVALLLTAHNEIYQVGPGSKDTAEIQIVCSKFPTLLYSGCIKLVRADHFLIASGTVFGEIVVWTCSKIQTDTQWIANVRHFYLGHRGSIFGVALSDPLQWRGEQRTLLASCSDDRTIRIWDVSLPETEDEIPSTASYVDRDTGFGSVRGDSGTLAMAWGHLSRIWDVQFVPECTFGDQDDITILSRGEDGVLQHWKMNKADMLSKQEDVTSTLQPVYHDRHHAGKNVWSWAGYPTEDTYQVLTGGADGQIIARSLRSPQWQMMTCSAPIPFTQIFSRNCERDDGVLQDSKLMGKAFKQYLLFANGIIIATTDTGSLARGSAKDIRLWLLIQEGNQRTTKVLSTNHLGRLAFFSQAHGGVAAYDVVASRIIEIDYTTAGSISSIQVPYIADNPATEENGKYLLLRFHGDTHHQLLILQTEGGKFVTTEKSLQTPSDFVATSSCIDGKLDLLVCGSRSGALMVFDVGTHSSTDIEPALCVRHIHDSDTVTSIQVLPRKVDGKEKDSYFLTTGRDGTYAVHRLSITDGEQFVLTTVHRSKPPFGPSIEGAYFCNNAHGGLRLILYGFRSKDFVVWDETRQKQLMSVDCGGAHRNWDYRPSHTADSIGTFVWTKAGTINTFQQPNESCDIIASGGHGREIKAMAISPHRYEDKWRLIATGAEDTNIRLFRYNSATSDSDSDGPFQCMQVLPGHTTGLQHLVFSADGRYLFSSGGCEEMYVWQLQEVPVIGMGAVLKAKLPKEAEDSDARIMGFDVRESDASYQVWLAYSNGKVKSFEYSTANSQFLFIGETVVGATCLTQACCSYNDHFAIGATDGQLRILSCADMTYSQSSKIHQNNIAGMTVSKLDDHHSLIVTGGDDSALGFSLASVDGTPRIQTIMVASAHAAAVTAVTTLRAVWDGNICTAVVVSAGNDQKVKVWSIELPHHDRTSSDVKDEIRKPIVTKIEEFWTDVADISSMGVLYESATVTEVYTIAVAGVGLQFLQAAVGAYEKQPG